MSWRTGSYGSPQKSSKRKCKPDKLPTFVKLLKPPKSAIRKVGCVGGLDCYLIAIWKYHATLSHICLPLSYMHLSYFYPPPPSTPFHQVCWDCGSTTQSCYGSTYPFKSSISSCTVCSVMPWQARDFRSQF